MRELGPPSNGGCGNEVRRIIHVDMDAFYASVEQRDHPELRKRPVAVGGPAEGRGVIAAASYEARAYGVRSAMPSAHARRLCPNLVVVPPRFSVYRAVSEEVQALLREVTDLVEPLSLDEAFLDVTENRWNEPKAGVIARRLKTRIRAATGLVASAGAGPSKLVAKLASDLDKPDGLVVVPPDRVDAFLGPLPARRLWGVGPVTAKKLEGLGLFTVSDVRAARPERLEALLGRYGRKLHELASGIDDRPVIPEREAKSVGVERTYPVDLRRRDEVEAQIRLHAWEVSERLRRHGRAGRTVTLKLRFSDFATLTRSRSTSRAISSAGEIEALARDLYANVEVSREGASRPSEGLETATGGALIAPDPGGEGPTRSIRPAGRRRAVRLVGISVSALEPIGGERQLPLFEVELEVEG